MDYLRCNVAAPVSERRWRHFHRPLHPSDDDVANTARLLGETEENTLSLFRREPSGEAVPRGGAAATEMRREPMKRGPCFGWRPTKSQSRENRGRGAQTVGILSTQDVSAGLDL